MRKIKNLLKIIDKILIDLKGILFKNKDIISGKELVEYDIVSRETEKILYDLKKLRRINNIYYVWDYNNEFKKLIFSYKYKRKIILSKIIVKLIKEEFEFIMKNEKIDVVVSVPISKKRMNERGFNQVDEILNKLNINYIKLKRIKNTSKMHKLLDEKLREKNIKGSFYINKKIDLKNKKILLVDDIITTGSTLREIKNSILNSSNNQKTEIIVFCFVSLHIRLMVLFYILSLPFFLL